MVSTKNKKLPLIKYTSRDFESIKRDLVDYKRRYYPNISKDENESSFDDLMMDIVSYVGDQLSFYLDYSVNESFLDTAVEFNNILRLAKPLGFRITGNPTSSGIASFYVIVPATSTGLGPDTAYLPILKKGTELSSIGGNSFILNEDVDFSHPQNPVVVARVNEQNGLPTSYAVKATGRIISGKILEELITIGEFKKFLKIELSGRNISEIISVVDSDGNEYFEVDYLSQDLIFKAIPNKTSTSTVAPYLLRPFVVPRRFTVDRERTRTFLQFGFGSERDATSDPLIDPSRVILNVHGKDHVTDVSFDPTNILGTDKLGIAPSNTTLRITYRVNTADNVNTSENSITQVVSPLTEFDDINSLNLDTVRGIIGSIEVTNEKAIVGDVSLPTIEELKIRVFDRFSSQNRAVTTNDYKSFVYSMPAKYGSVKRINVVQDSDSFKRNINMYIISENRDGTLVETNQTIKENIKFWLQHGKMINDTIDLLDLKIVNIGIDFNVVAEEEYNKFDVLNNCLANLKNRYSKKEEGGNPFSITEVYKILQKTVGVVDVLDVKIYQKKGGNYSDTRISIDELISSDNRYIITPQNVIFEIKDVDADIKGSIR